MTSMQKVKSVKKFVAAFLVTQASQSMRDLGVSLSAITWGYSVGKSAAIYIVPAAAANAHLQLIFPWYLHTFATHCLLGL